MKALKIPLKLLKQFLFILTVTEINQNLLWIFPLLLMDLLFYRDLSDNHLEELPSDLLANLSILQELCVKPCFSLNFIKVVVNVSSAIQETGKIG